MTYAEFASRDSGALLLDISFEATRVFGFVFQDRVSTPKGPASVLGVSKSGHLYFQLDSDTGCSFWGSCKTQEDFEKRGFCIIPEDNERRHRVKTVKYQGRSRRIILQDKNGPCPLLAALNAMSLRGDPVPILESGCDVVTQSSICAAVVDAMRAAGEFSVHHFCQVASSARTLRDLIANESVLLRKHFSSERITALYEGLDVSPLFTHVSAFEGERDAAFFSALGLPLFHLWVADDLPPNLRDKSFNQLQDLAVSDVADSSLAASFLELYPGQATPLGVEQLRESLSEGEVSVAFRNNHFSTVVKLNGELLVLVTDEGYGDKSLIVFEALSLSGDSAYRDGLGASFSPAVLSVLETHGDQYSAEELQNALLIKGSVATVSDLVSQMESARTQPRSAPQGVVSQAARPHRFFDELVEMGFDVHACETVCSQQPESLEVAVALLLAKD